MKTVIRKGKRVRQILMGAAIGGLAVGLSACAPPESPPDQDWQEQPAPVQPQQQEQQAPVAPAPQQDAEPIQPEEPQPAPFAPAE